MLLNFKMMHIVNLAPSRGKMVIQLNFPPVNAAESILDFLVNTFFASFGTYFI